MLPKGFISTQDAIELVEAHSKEEPTVDIAFLATNIGYIKLNKTFTIHLRKKSGNKVVNSGTTWTIPKKASEVALLKEAITNTLKRTRGILLDPEDIKTFTKSTVVDPDTNPQGRPTKDDTANQLLGTPDGNTMVSGALL